MKTSTHIFLKYHVLVWVCPCVSIACILNYIISVFVIHDGYAGAYWGLLASIWSTSLIGYLIKYRIGLRQNKKKSGYFKIPSSALPPSLLPGLSPSTSPTTSPSTSPPTHLSPSTSPSPSPFVARTSVNGDTTRILLPTEEESVRMYHDSSTFDLDDVFAGGERRFYLTAWGGLGIAVCVVGMMCGFAAFFASFLLRQYEAGALALLSAVFAAISVYTIITHRPRRRTKPPFVWNVTYISKILGKGLLVVLVLLLIPVFMLSSLQQCVNAYNAAHFRPLGQLYNVGGGHKMHLHCKGHGSPVVLLNHAITGQALDWSWIQPKIANITKTCSFDRTGYGWSQAFGTERTSVTHANELNNLIQAAGLGGEQFIMVGHAQSIVYMQHFIRAYTQHDVCGLLCVDCMDANSTEHEYDSGDDGHVDGIWIAGRNLMPSGLFWLLAAMDKLPMSETMTHLARSVHEEYLQNVLKPRYAETVVLEYEHLPKSVQQTRGTGDLGDLPMITIAAGRGFNSSGVAKLSSNSTSLYLATAPNNMIFHEAYSSMIAQRVGELVHLYKISGCNTFAPGTQR